MSGFRLPPAIAREMWAAVTDRGFKPGETAGVFCDECHTLFWVEADIDGVPHIPDHDHIGSVVRADETQGDTDDRGHMPTR